MMNSTITYQDERHMPMARYINYQKPMVRYEQPEQVYPYDSSKRYDTIAHNMDAADALLSGLEKSLADKNWALQDDGPFLFSHDGNLGQAAGTNLDPFPLNHSNTNDNWCADSRMLSGHGSPRPTQSGRVYPTLFQLPQDNDCMKRSLQQSSQAISTMTPASKRSRRSDACDADSKKLVEKIQMGQCQGRLEFKTSNENTFQTSRTLRGRIHPKVTTTAPKAVSPTPDPVEVASEQEALQVEEDLPKFRDYQEQQWQEQYKGLIEFKTKQGHCCVPNTYEPNTILGRWVKRQRYQYKLRQAGQQSTLVASRVQALEDVGFVWDSHAALWEERLNELKHYRQSNGHCNVPSTYPKNKKLSTWVKCQRRQFRLTCKGKNSNLTAERIAALDDLGFVWDGRTIGGTNKQIVF